MGGLDQPFAAEFLMSASAFKRLPMFALLNLGDLVSGTHRLQSEITRRHAIFS